MLASNSNETSTFLAYNVQVHQLRSGRHVQAYQNSYGSKSFSKQHIGAMSVEFYPFLVPIPLLFRFTPALMRNVSLYTSN